MKRKDIPMSFEEFEKMEHPFGWKAEYWDGKAVLSPRDIHVKTKLSLTQRSLSNHFNLKPTHPSLKPQMIEAFYEAFEDSVEFCDWPQEKIREHAENNLKNYFDGFRGEPQAVSVMAVEPNQDEIAGLVLFTNKKGSINLDLLFVKPLYQRQGMATEMVSFAVNQLFDQGIREVYSAYHVCNENSQKWHHSFGFEDIYDQFYIRMKFFWVQHEIWRVKELGWNDRIKQLIQEKDYWYSQLEDEWKF